LVGYWSFEGKTVSGTQVYDASGQGNYGTMTNGPKLVYGKIGPGMEFTTLNNTVSVSNNSVFKTIPLSISFWMNMNILPPVRGENERPMGKQHGSSPFASWYFDVASSNNKLSFATVTSGGSQGSAISDNSIQTDRWYHVVGVCDETLTVLYLDGVRHSTTTSCTSMVDSDGGPDIGSPNGFEWVGLLDDIRIYNRALSADEVKCLYKIGATAKLGLAAANDSLAKGLVGWWNFDGNTISGTRVFDASGTGNYGTMTNGPTLVNGKLGQAMQFYGVNDYVDFGDPSVLTLGSTLIYAAAGADSAYDRTFPVTVFDGTLNLTFSASVENAKVNAIKIVPASSGPTACSQYTQSSTIPTG
jgi:hypothetical protein